MEGGGKPGGGEKPKAKGAWLGAAAAQSKRRMWQLFKVEDPGAETKGKGKGEGEKKDGEGKEGKKEEEKPFALHGINISVPR